MVIVTVCAPKRQAYPLRGVALGWISLVWLLQDHLPDALNVPACAWSALEGWSLVLQD